MEEAFLICFFVGLAFTFISFLLSGIFGGHDAHAGDVDAGDLDLGHVEAEAGEADISHDFDLGHDFDHDLAEAGGDGHVEIGLSDGFPGLSPWSPTVLSAFVTTFGGAGYLALTQTGTGAVISSAVGLLAAFLFAGGVFLGMNRIFAAVQASSEWKVASLVGRDAKVITPIPEDGVGEISYEAGGSRSSAPARTVDGKPVDRARIVKIVRVAGTTYLVKPR